MRIRKNARISEFLNTKPNLSRDADECQLQTLCQLNQSPWDIITFPSSDSSASAFHQFDDDNEVYFNVNLAKNGNSIESSGDFESVASKTSELGENHDNFNGKNDRKKDYGEILGFKEVGETSREIQEEINYKLCGKRDEKGWQCGRNVVKYGNTMCDYHLSKLQNDGVWSTKKKPGPVTTTGTRRCRRKKRPTTGPNDFYYYSGFGPSWAKKRGVSNVCNEGGINDSIDGDMEAQKETGKRFKAEISEVGAMELDYVDDDEEDEDENGKVGIVGRKRVRKPIKEKSLKSLMR